MLGRFAARNVQRHNIGLLKKTIQIDVRHVISVREYVIRLGIAGKNVQTKPLRDFHNTLTDSTGTDHSKGFALQIESLQAFLRKIPLASAIDRLWNLVANGKEQRKNMLRNSLVTVDGHIADWNRISGAILQIDMVVSRRPGSNELQMLKTVKDRVVQDRMNERGDDIGVPV